MTDHAKLRASYHEAAYAASGRDQVKGDRNDVRSGSASTDRSEDAAR
jgi:hypothetical protein